MVVEETGQTESLVPGWRADEKSHVVGSGDGGCRGRSELLTCMYVLSLPRCLDADNSQKGRCLLRNS